jgi:ATP-dependent RNA helicase DDX41
MSRPPPGKVSNFETFFLIELLLTQFFHSQRYRRAEIEDEELKSKLEDLEDSNYVPYVPVRERRREKLKRLDDKLNKDKLTKNVESSDSEKEDNTDEEDAQAHARRENISLLDQHTELKRMAEGF